MAVFTESMINERFQAFWAALQRGEFITDAAAEAGTYRKKGAQLDVPSGPGTGPANRCLSCGPVCLESF